MDNHLTAVLRRVERHIRADLGELRYQLLERNGAPLSGHDADDLVDLLVELESRGLVELELCARLTDDGKRVLADDDVDAPADVELEQVRSERPAAPKPAHLTNTGRGRSRSLRE